MSNQASSNNSSIVKWVVLALLCAVVAVLLRHPAKHNDVTMPAPADKPTVAPAQENVPTSTVTEVLGSNDAPAVSTVPVEKKPVNVVAKSLSPVAVPEEQAVNDQSAEPSINALPTQQQIIDTLTAQNKKIQTREMKVADRADQISKVHKAIIDSGAASAPVSGNVNIAPLLTPPDDIAQKIKSHQLTAH